MDLVSIFSTVVLVTTIVTLILALAAYFAYKVREWRKPKSSGGGKISADGVFEPIFLKRHMLSSLEHSPDEHIVST
ncbi:MAG: hypothetical protein NTY60_04780 [Proteobacteria bacterium]|nr:hypothetical protein [Pseudomonadota bacterium]